MQWGSYGGWDSNMLLITGARSWKVVYLNYITIHYILNIYVLYWHENLVLGIFGVSRRFIYLVLGIWYIRFGAWFIYLIFGILEAVIFCINYQFAPKARFFWGILLLTERKNGISIFNLGFDISIFEPDSFIWYLVFENRRIDLFGIWYWDFQIIIYSTKIPKFHARTVLIFSEITFFANQGFAIFCANYIIIMKKLTPFSWIW